MSGGISYVIEKLQSGQRPYGTEVRAKKGSYEGYLGPRKVVHIVHYGTEILKIDPSKHRVSGGYGSVSSSQAVNKVLRAYNVPCSWSRAERSYGFWCTAPWKGDPSGETNLQAYIKRKEIEAKRKAEIREAERPGGLLRVPKHKYSKLAVQKMTELQNQWLSERGLSD